MEEHSVAQQGVMRAATETCCGARRKSMASIKADLDKYGQNATSTAIPKISEARAKTRSKSKNAGGLARAGVEWSVDRMYLYSHTPLG